MTEDLMDRAQRIYERISRNRPARQPEPDVVVEREVVVKLVKEQPTEEFEKCPSMTYKKGLTAYRMVSLFLFSLLLPIIVYLGFSKLSGK